MDDRIRALLSARNFAHVATVMPSGAPHSVPVWAKVIDDHIAFFTQPASQKARNLARDPRVAISVVDRENPYRMGQVRGRVTATVEGEAALDIIDAISDDYTGRPFPMRSGVVFLVEPEREFAMELPFEDPGPS